MSAVEAAEAADEVSGAALFRAGLLAAFGGAVRRGWTGVGRGSKEGGSRAASPRPQAPQAPHDGLLSVATQARPARPAADSSDSFVMNLITQQAHPAGEPARWLHPLGREALAEASAALPSEAVFGLDHFGVAAPSLLADRAARDLFWQSHLRWLAQLDVWHACL
ncbi:hypothetical protein EMIHUDRAFT_233773 [Emiliania huxleyi CCMP1516]|uniref:Uncharacterized protein n=2 Tax=Emiliania huxleyi TaxID=2903 RepID=A0A0D3K1C6_EMIH1|nr:hypothetical protein EMIHUDRAFT_233773 [Emiliania huxleyi CCMP1516]EOD29561.1 hypothetical protein EMIHUDRAFT_233773 [Emiliania huxleyi CCMP1516]|eukprot:XP_005781990.1 hypothetical protein EMIHUDRAFT_233773 [Emiliania huxleyi CCMP1516]